VRTGQAHRTLQGHTAPVTCVQFDEQHIVSGSADGSVRIWDVRTGGAVDTLRYERPVTALQFDSRKIVVAAGDNGAKVGARGAARGAALTGAQIYNRTSMQQSTLTTNGHMGPAERLRYIDRYLVTGGRDSVVKVWAL
jgi:division protein 1